MTFSGSVKYRKNKKYLMQINCQLMKRRRKKILYSALCQFFFFPLSEPTNTAHFND